MDRDADFRLLLVCMGNICRSPMAEGVLRARLAERDLGLRVFVDSAGTHGYHTGAPPDPRARAAAARRGYEIGELRARQVLAEDFERFDLLLAMDRDNLAELQALAPTPELRQRARLFLEFASERGDDVPDPYYGGSTGFERVLDLVEDAVDGLLNRLPELAGRAPVAGD
ncbi:MAG: low molecular weight phosphotyrosine protein phosphatase [Gammaproteobacteria bacterium]|nr:MAG: low molecular weight phosphotyrosine protein phosphatase [Gammaproteobacteria bacterium]